MIVVVLGALSWTFVGPEGGDITSVAMESNRALAASLKVAYYSTDSAHTWNRIDMEGYSGLGTFFQGFETAILSGRFFVFHSAGFIYSDDGTAWTPVPTDRVVFVGEASGSHLFFIAGNTVYMLSTGDASPVSIFGPASPDTVMEAVGSLDSLWFAVARTPSGELAVYRGVYDTVVLTGVFTVNGQVNDVEINPYDPDEVILATMNGLYVSQDAGSSFSQDVGSLFGGVAVAFDVEFFAADSIFVSSFYFPGLYEGYRGFMGWSLSPIYTDAIVRDLEGNLLAAIGIGVVSMDDGTFQERNDGLYAHTFYNPGMISNTRDDRLSVINTGGLAFYTDDGGVSWNYYDYKMDIGTAIEVSSMDHQIVFIGGFKASGNMTSPGATVLVRSTDGGNTFDVLRDTSVVYAYTHFPMEIQLGSDVNNVFMVSGNPGSWVMEYSSDGGDTFDTVKTASGYNGFCFSCIDTLFMVIDTGDVYVSYDAGATWDYLTHIGYSGDVYTTYRDGYLYYSTGHDAYLRYIDVETGSKDSLDLSTVLDSIGQIQVSVNGDFFLTGFLNGAYKIAYGPTLADLTLEDAPDFGGIIPLSDHVFFFALNEGGFYVSPYPTSTAENLDGLKVRYMASGVFIEGVDGSISIYDVRGRLVRRMEGKFIAYSTLPAGIYVAKTSKGSVRIVVR